MSQLRVVQVAPHVGLLTWADEAWLTGPAASAQVARRLEEAFAGGVHRVEAEVTTTSVELRRALQQAGMRPEGLARGRGAGPDGAPVDVLRLARLAGDPPPGTGASFLAMLNATLPTKRVIAQGLIRDDDGAVLLCELTYKGDWDLPGGVVDPWESPAASLVREVTEELGVVVEPGPLLALNWLPPYRQWDDAVLLVFDLGRRPELTACAVLQRQEIRALHWCRPQDLEARVAPYVARHLRAVLAAEPAAGPLYLEDGFPTGR